MEQEIAVHSNVSGVVIVIYPGYRGDMNGYNNKYQKIAELLSGKGTGAVVRMSNHAIPDVEYSKSLKDSLRSVINHILQRSKEICGSDSPRLYLMGVSAGASAIAAVAHEYDKVEKILLIEPSGDAGIDDIKAGLSKYTGKVYVVVGANSHIKVGGFFSSLVMSAKINKLVIISDCDHQFRGKVNGMIFGKAPLWAFAGDSTFPSPDGGIELYD